MRKSIIMILIVWLMISLSAELLSASDNSVPISQRIDLNKASLEEIKSLPITEQQAYDIYDYRENISFFPHIYALRQIESIDQRTLNLLKKHVVISHYDEKDAVAERRDEIYYLIQRLGSNEGLQEGMSDVWEDYLITPQNINKMSFSEMLNFPNVSAVDAYSIQRRKALGDTISSYRDLRRTEGISYYGASNLRHYVYYSEAETEDRVYFDYQLKYDTTPFSDTQYEMYEESMLRYDSNSSNPELIRDQNYWSRLKMQDINAEVTNKIRLRYNNQWKAGIIYNDNQPANSLLDIDGEIIKHDMKYYVGYENEVMPNNNLKIYVGNYRATFGEGLVMESTDYFSPRTTGLGFNKRIKGIIGDISRTEQYALKGTAVEWNTPQLSATLFLSSDLKDAVVWDSNDNGIIDDDDDLFAYVQMSSRFDNDDLQAAEEYFNENSSTDINFAPRRDAFTENIIGGHFQYSPFIGTSLGFTGYEARYDRDFTQPNEDDIKDLLIWDYRYNTERKWGLENAEITSMYETKSDEYGYDRDYRRVVGLDWLTTINNTSFQGEYAEMEVDGDLGKIGENPSALLISSRTQFENFNFLSIYRDYDIEFDNPYHRSFGETNRYDDTVLDKSYVVNNSLLNDMVINGVQPEAEKGVYLETRYQFNRYLTLSKMYLDIWQRKSDARKGVRFETKLDFKPIHQIRLRTRYKAQTKRWDDTMHRGRSKSEEYEISYSTNLSNFDRLGMTFIFGSVSAPPYPLITYPGESGGADMAQASNVYSNGTWLEAYYIHNINKNLKVSGSFAYWNADGASFWDFEDSNLDFDHTDKGMKYWLTFSQRISDNLSLNMKFKHKRYRSREIQIRQYNELINGEEYYFRNVQREYSAIRIQLDWKI
ncbi:MAG: helix-hairpin-helix domain-containing protein [Candidatus Cloacimonadales bacterium]